jgi:hypothetical protein
VSEHIADPMDPTAPMPTDDAFSSGMVALEHSPAALGLATLAGDLLYLNTNGERLFGVAHSVPLTGRNLADICSDAGQFGALEAVARDGRARSLVIRVGSESIRMLCKLTRIDGYGGIPTWLAFAGFERDDFATDDESPLSDAESLSIMRRLSNVAAWKMPINTRDSWTQSMMHWDAGVHALLNLKPTHSKVAAQHFLEGVAREDRELAGDMLDPAISSCRHAQGWGVPSEVSVDDLHSGTLVAEDIRKTNGVLIVPRGVELSRSVIAHIGRFRSELAKGTVSISSAEEEESDASSLVVEEHQVPELFATG